MEKKKKKFRLTTKEQIDLDEDVDLDSIEILMAEIKIEGLRENETKAVFP